MIQNASGGGPFMAKIHCFARIDNLTCKLYDESNTLKETLSLGTARECLFNVLGCNKYYVRSYNSSNVMLTEHEIIINNGEYKEIYCGVKIVEFASGTDAELAAMIDADDKGFIDIHDYWHVGDMREMQVPEIGGPYGSERLAAETNRLVLVDTDKYYINKSNTLEDNYQNKSNFIITWQHPFGDNTTASVFRFDASDATPYKDTRLFGWLNTQFYNAIFSNDLKSMLKKMKIPYAEKENLSSEKYAYGFFSIPAAVELRGSEYNGASPLSLSVFSYFSNTTARNFPYPSSGNNYIYELTRSVYNSSGYRNSLSYNGNSVTVIFSYNPYRIRPFCAI